MLEVISIVDYQIAARVELPDLRFRGVCSILEVGI